MTTAHDDLSLHSIMVLETVFLIDLVMCLPPWFSAVVSTVATSSDAGPLTPVPFAGKQKKAQPGVSLTEPDCHCAEETDLARGYCSCMHDLALELALRLQVCDAWGIIHLLSSSTRLLPTMVTQSGKLLLGRFELVIRF